MNGFLIGLAIGAILWMLFGFWMLPGLFVVNLVTLGLSVLSAMFCVYMMKRVAVTKDPFFPIKREELNDHRKSSWKVFDFTLKMFFSILAIGAVWTIFVLK